MAEQPSHLFGHSLGLVRLLFRGSWRVYIQRAELVLVSAFSEGPAGLCLITTSIPQKRGEPDTGPLRAVSGVLSFAEQARWKAPPSVGQCRTMPFQIAS
eukprot:13280545-Alexandrium_andersonii.AAC.1